jgi:8-oxo-dGTP diphosphatase
MVYSYKYPRPMVTVDIAVFRYAKSTREILLIKRKHHPFEGEWALPGGFIKPDEQLHTAARRELQEETGLRHDFLFPLITADYPQRDPRGRTISFVFGCIQSPPFPDVRGANDAASAAWHNLAALPDLAFDHQDVIRRSLEQLKFDLQTRFHLFTFLPVQFTRSDWDNLSRDFEIASDQASRWIDMALQKEILKKLDQRKFERVNSLQVYYESSKFH